MKIFYATKEREIAGPIDVAALRQLRSSGEITDETLVVAEGESEWTTYSSRPWAAKQAPLPPPLPAPSHRSSIAATPAGPATAARQAENVVPAHGRPRVSSAAVRLAKMARRTSGEFDALEVTCFPSSRGTHGLFHLTAPLCWDFFYRLHGGIVCQLYLTVTGRDDHGAVHYNLARLPGGNQLEVKHITTEYREQPIEHMVINVDIDLLRSHIDKTLRIQVSRPDRGLEFIVDVPSEMTAAVLYYRRPADFEVEQTDENQADSPEGAASPVAAILGGIGGAIIGGLIGAIFFGKLGLATGLAIGGWAGAQFIVASLRTSRASDEAADAGARKSATNSV